MSLVGEVTGVYLSGWRVVESVPSWGSHLCVPFWLVGGGVYHSGQCAVQWVRGVVVSAWSKDPGVGGIELTSVHPRQAKTTELPVLILVPSPN